MENSKKFNSLQDFLCVDLDGAANLRDPMQAVRKYTPIYTRREVNSKQTKSKQNDYVSVVVTVMELAGIPPAWFKHKWLAEFSPKLFSFFQNNLLVSGFEFGAPISALTNFTYL